MGDVVESLECRHPSSHGSDRRDAGVTLGSSQAQSRSFYVFEKHIKISEVIMHDVYA